MDSSRVRSRSFSDRNEIFFIGEELRTRINFANLIKDRKYHFKTYKNCFIGKEVVSWLVGCKLCDSRASVVKAMQILQDNYIIHHVCDDHNFKDDMLFYRFRKDDGTYENDIDFKLFIQGLKIYRLLSVKKKTIIRDYQLNSHVYKNAFIGSVFVDWVMKTERIALEDAVDLGRKFLDFNIIKHVTDDHHFKHDNCLLYQFAFNFEQKFCFHNVFKYFVRSHSRNTSDCSIPEKVHRRQTSISSEISHSSTDSHDDYLSDLKLPEAGGIYHEKFGSISSDDSEGADGNEGAYGLTSPRSVMLRNVTASELESPDTPYIKKILRIPSDSVGYGFVLRGNGPTYVQTIDPSGPAAAAGLKVRQYIHSVNGTNVLRCNHKEVAKMIMDVEQYLQLSVMVHKRDALFTDFDN